MAAIKKVSVPFDDAGNMMHSDWRGDANYVEYEGTFSGRFIFDQILKYTSNVAYFKDGMDRHFYMSQGEFERIIPFMVRGVLEGQFYFRKQGKYYSLMYKEDAVI